MSELPLPLQYLFELGHLTPAGTTVTVEPKPGDLPRIATWAGVAAVEKFKGIVSLRRISTSRFGFEADLSADIVQACVVTLEPVAAHIERHVERELHYVPRAPVEEGELTLAAGDDDVPETITSLEYDLAGPLLEEFALAIDPYPRKAGAAFAAPVETEEVPESPFAVLKSLKDRG